MHFSQLVTLAAISCGSTLAVQLNIVSVGASITFGYKSSRGNGYRDDMLYSLQDAGHQVRMLGTQTGGTCYQPSSEGYPGFVIDQVKGKFEANFDKLQFKPNVIVTLVGTNDMRPSSDGKTAAPDRYNTLLDTYRSHCEECVIIASSLPPNGNQVQNAAITEFNGKIKNLVNARAAKGEHILFSDQASRLTVAADMADDKYHPNDEGYKLIGLDMAEQIKKAVSNGWTKSVSPVPQY